MLVTMLLSIAVQYRVPAQEERGIEPHVNFLGNERASAKEYILSMFKDKDMVILCERDHRELTQYDLMLDVIGDPYFVDNVAVVFTEVGARNLNPGLNAFLQKENLTGVEIDKQVLKFQRDCLFSLWEKSNFSYFIKGIYKINQGLPAGKKIQLYPSDVFYVEGKPNIEKVRNMLRNVANRDGMMADNIMALFDLRKKGSSRKKALVIMNYRHALRHTGRRHCECRAAFI